MMIFIYIEDNFLIIFKAYFNKLLFLKKIDLIKLWLWDCRNYNKLF